MATIHDVARMAGVSSATVSKHINKTGYVGAEKRAAIDQAIEALHYVTSRPARQLKLGISKEVLYIMPNMDEKLYREVLSGITATLGTEYRLVIQLTYDNAEKEREILRDCLSSPCAGILLCTCAPQATQLFEALSEKMPLIFLLRKPDSVAQFNYLGFNQFNAIYALVNELIRAGHGDIGLYAGDNAFSCEAECIEAFNAAFEAADQPVLANRVYSFPFSREATFRSIMTLLDSGDYPRVFLTTSYLAAQAINEVAYFRNLELGRDIFLLALGEDSWYHSMFVNRIIRTFRDAQKLGANAAAVLRKNIDAPMVCERVMVNLDDGFTFHKVGDYLKRLKESLPPAINAPRRGAARRKIKIAFNMTDSGTDALKSLLPQFVKRENVEVEFCPLPHDGLYDLLLRLAKEKSGEYDLFSVDVPWLPLLHQEGLLSDLTDLIKSNDFPAQLASGVLENTASLDGRILGLPYMYSLLMLFYRKDLFNDAEIAERFYRKYKVRLKPPDTWHMFNIIASFFTRAFEPESPTEYGTSIFGGNFPAAICSELFPRIWSYGGTVFDAHGCVRLYSQENYGAYRSLLKTIGHCPPGTLNFNAFHGVQQLISGDIAMCVFFSNNASPLADSVRNPIRDKLGFAPIPERKPVISGWSIGVNRYSSSTEHAFNFIRWFSSMELQSAYSILGGSAPITALLEHEPLVQLYPWNSLVRMEYHTAQPRMVPALSGIPLLDESWIESVLSDVIFNVVNEKGVLDIQLYHAHMKLCQYAEEHSYPRNVPPKRLVL